MTKIEQRLFPIWYKKYVHPNENPRMLHKLITLGMSYNEFCKGYTNTISFKLFMLNIHFEMLLRTIKIKIIK